MPDDVTGDTGTAQKAHPKKANPFSTRVRVIQLSFLTLAVLATIGLAWWQWERWSSGGGSFQNLGYAMQWPAFGAFFIIAYRKYMEYERERVLGEEAPAVAKDKTADTPREIPQDILDELDNNRHLDGKASTGAGGTASTAPAFVDDRRRAARQAREAGSGSTASTANNTDRTGTTDPR